MLRRHQVRQILDSDATSAFEADAVNRLLDTDLTKVIEAILARSDILRTKFIMASNGDSPSNAVLRGRKGYEWEGTSIDIDLIIAGGIWVVIKCGGVTLNGEFKDAEEVAEAIMGMFKHGLGGLKIRMAIERMP